MEKVYDAIDIARYIIDKCAKEGKSVSNLQIQKIMYFLQKEYLKNHSHELFPNEIQAWQFGPVVPDVYYQYCGYGSMPISLNYVIDVEEEDKAIIDKIVQDKRVLNPWDLVAETHAIGKAWSIVYKNGMGNFSTIPKKLIQYKG